MDQDRHPADRGELLLGLDQPGAIPDVDPVGVGPEVGAAVGLRVVGGDDDPLDAFEEQLLDDAGHVHLALRILSSGHRHRAVVEQLVGDVDPGCDGGADSERPGVEERAVAQVLDDVRPIDERRHADPLGALVAHRREPGDIADPLGVHHGHHGVAADASTDERALRNAGRDIVGATAAIERGAVHLQRDAGGLRSGGQRGEAGLVEPTRQAGAQRRQQLVGVDRPGAGDQRSAVLVMAADHDRPFIPSPLGTAQTQGVEGPFDEDFEGRVLLLDDDHLGEAVGELANLVVVEGHGHRQPHHPDPAAAQRLVVGEAEQTQRFAQLVIGVPRGGDAQPVVFGADGDLVELVEHAVLAGEHRANLLELALHVQRVRGEQAPTRMGDELLALVLHRRDHRHDPVGVDVDGAGAVGHCSDELVAGPHPARPRQGDGVAAEVERLLHVAGEDDRHVQVDHRGVAGAGQRRRLGGGIVADDGDDAAVARRAGEHAVADGVVGAVEAGSLAVPDAEDAVVLALGSRVGELAAHHSRGGELLVDPGTHHDGQVGGGARRPADLLLKRPDGRTLIPGHEGGGVEAVAPVDAQLVDR